ncbi:hypothetical protein BDN71DRAFT_186186 [Pleurotus eryngii]|uniref:Uncharacterized protein n=1 Tax=Pleurotus eryngii TaxID=5323 RepID=A0A9P6A593_PLEER|nr:hypothetical protein BDN71DRAFT_186186 [Pleurotus eryngii]
MPPADLPQYLVRSFTTANQPQFSTDESVFYGPYTRLLYYLFGLDGDFEIQPQFHVPHTARDSIDVVATFTIEYNYHPVMFIKIKPPGTFDNDSKRKEADDQMRDRFLSLRRSLITPRMPAVSAFGTHLAFYEYEVATNAVAPPAIPADPFYLTDTAPAERWNYDVLDAAGFVRLCQVVEDVKQMCQAVNH